MELPSGFIEMMRRLLGDDADAFFLAMEKAPVVSVRLNGRKPGVISKAAPYLRSTRCFMRGHITCRMPRR